MKINKNEKERRIEGRDYGGVHPSATERIAQRAFSRTLMNCRALFISLSLYLFFSFDLFLFPNPCGGLDSLRNSGVLCFVALPFFFFFFAGRLSSPCRLYPCGANPLFTAHFDTQTRRRETDVYIGSNLYYSALLHY